MMLGYTCDVGSLDEGYEDVVVVPAGAPREILVALPVPVPSQR